MGKHTWPKTHPTNPTRGVKGAKTAVLDGANLCRVTYPTPTRHYPTTPATATLCRVVSGTCRVNHPTRVFAMRKGINPTLRGTCRVCRVGFQGGVVMPVDLEVLARLIDSETYPANPAKGFERVKNPVPDGGNPCRVVYPAPTRQNPAKPGTPPLAGYLPGTAGYLPGEVPGTDFADEEGYKPPLEGDLPGLPGGFQGGCDAD